MVACTPAGMRTWVVAPAATVKEVVKESPGMSTCPVAPDAPVMSSESVTGSPPPPPLPLGKVNQNSVPLLEIPAWAGKAHRKSPAKRIAHTNSWAERFRRSETKVVIYPYLTSKDVMD